MVRSCWKSIFISKLVSWSDQTYQVHWWKKNVVLTEFFFKKSFKVYCGKVPHTVHVNDLDFLGFKFGEFIQTRIPFVHRRAKNKKKKDKKKFKKRQKKIIVISKVKQYIKSTYRANKI